MPRFLLDTNTISDLIRNPVGRVFIRLAQIDPAAICTSAIVASELRYGAKLKASARLSRKVEEILLRLTVLPFESPSDERYAEVRSTLERRGEQLSANNLFIAAHALAINSVLVTDDRAFDRVVGLSLENWLN